MVTELGFLIGRMVNVMYKGCVRDTGNNFFI